MSHITLSNSCILFNSHFVLWGSSSQNLSIWFYSYNILQIGNVRTDWLCHKTHLSHLHKSSFRFLSYRLLELLCHWYTVCPVIHTPGPCETVPYYTRTHKKCLKNLSCITVSFFSFTTPVLSCAKILVTFEECMSPNTFPASLFSKMMRWKIKIHTHGFSSGKQKQPEQHWHL